MKKIVIIALAAVIVLGIGTASFAKSRGSSSSSSESPEIDFSLVFASAPASGFDSTVGIDIGAGVMLPQIDKNLQGRIDISYFSWSESVFGFGDLDYTRVPITVSGRYFIPTQDDKFKVFVQGGLELSFDSVDVVGPFGKVSESDVHLGMVLGAGLDFKLAQNLSLVTDVRYHFITDGYATAQVGLAYNF